VSETIDEAGMAEGQGWDGVSAVVDEYRGEREAQPLDSWVQQQLQGLPIEEIIEGKMLVCARHALESQRQLSGELGIAPEFDILKGVQVDRVGTTGDDPTDRDTLTYGIAGKFLRGQPEGDALLEQVCMYNTNNNTLAYRDVLGRLFVAPVTDTLIKALGQAGYERNESIWVPCSNGDNPADVELTERLWVAREVAEVIETIQRLKTFGVDRTDELESLMAVFKDPESPQSERIRSQVGVVQEALAQFEKAKKEWDEGHEDVPSVSNAEAAGSTFDKLVASRQLPPERAVHDGGVGTDEEPNSPDPF
jgi:hypothetical protein